MALQLQLLDEASTGDASTTVRYDPTRFRLDARTRAVGLAGVARARAALEAARRSHDPLGEAA